MRIINAESVAKCLPYGELIEKLRVAFTQDTFAPERTNHTIKNTQDSASSLLLMPAWKHEGSIGIKIVSVFPENTANNLSAVHANYILMSAKDGLPKAIMDGSELTLRRTACASALAADYLAKNQTETLLMVGTGNLAPHLIRAHLKVRDYSKVLVWGRRKEKAENLVSSLKDLDIEILSIENIEKACSLADVISCATLSRDPLILGEWLKPGHHLDLVGAFTPEMREVDNEAIVKSRVVVDTYEGALSESGELIKALKDGDISKSHILSDMRGLILLKKNIREDESNITLFKSVGTALEDLAAAELVIEKI